VIHQDFFDEEDVIVHGRDRKAKKKIFRAVQTGDFDDFDEVHLAGSHLLSLLQLSSIIHYLSRS
jgi:hypothetical protein